MSSFEDLRTEDLGLWLADHLNSTTPVAVSDLEMPKAGFSNETIFFRAMTSNDPGKTEKRYVLRPAERGEAT